MPDGLRIVIRPEVDNGLSAGRSRRSVYDVVFAQVDIDERGQPQNFVHIAFLGPVSGYALTAPGVPNMQVTQFDADEHVAKFAKNGDAMQYSHPLPPLDRQDDDATVGSKSQISDENSFCTSRRLREARKLKYNTNKYPACNSRLLVKV